MKMIKGLAVATILLMGALVSPIPISYAQTTHSSNLVSIPLAISEVQEFGQGGQNGKETGDSKLPPGAA